VTYHSLFCKCFAGLTRIKVYLYVVRDYRRHLLSKQTL